MKFTLMLVIAALLGASDDPIDRVAPPSGPSNAFHEGTSLLARPLETPATEVRLGDTAPDFSFQASDGSWRHLKDVLAHGPVLLLFGPDELTLRVVEHERERLLDLGVLPMAVTDARPGAARALVQRDDLRFTLLADPRGTIAAQFNTVDPSNGRQLPAWFVLDARRRVRALGRRGLPIRGYPSLVADALGLPSDGSNRPASR